MPFTSLPIPTRTVDIVDIEEKARNAATKDELEQLRQEILAALVLLSNRVSALE
jgi:hypothetical protein